MKKVIKLIIKNTVFVIMFFSVLFYLQDALVCDSESKDAARIDSVFTQPENSLDAVFLGPSTTYASWAAPVAFKEYGITVYSAASAAQPMFASKFMIDDIKKKQPDAVYIINITHFLMDYEKYLPNFINTYPLTTNKLSMIRYLADLGDFSFKKTLELMFPIQKYHDRWTELKFKEFLPLKDEYKSASYYEPFLYKKKNVGSIQQDFSSYETLSLRDYRGLIDLMNYCKKEDIKALFVIIPQSDRVTDRSGKQNATVSILETRGFDVLDLREYASEIGFDTKTDFYNTKHMNISGAEKVTRFVSEFLIEKYGFKDKRGDAAYSDWAEDSERYYQLLETTPLVD